MTASDPDMSPSQPYLLRALNEWIVDNGLTPQIVVNPDHPGLDVPASAGGSERLVLNIAPSAVRDLLIDNEFVSFVARFSGVSHGVMVPIDAVQAVYARENGQGMMFPETASDETSDHTVEDNSDQKNPAAKSEDTGRPPRGKPSLKVIK